MSKILLKVELALRELRELEDRLQRDYGNEPHPFGELREAIYHLEEAQKKREKK